MGAQGLELRVAAVEKRLTRPEGPTGLRGLRSQILQLGREMSAGFSAMKQELEDTRAQMRVLHEDVIGRIALLGESATPIVSRAARVRKRSR